MSRDNRLLTLALFLWGVGEGLFWYIQPLYLRELGADAVTTGGILSLAGLTAAFAHTPAGYLADRLGRKTVMLAGWVLGLLACLGMYLAPDLATFTMAWVAYVFTAFALVPINAYALGARGHVSVERTLSLVWAGFSLGMLVSPALGGWVATQFGLRQIYLIGAGAFTLSTLIVALMRPQPTPHPEQRQRQHATLWRNGPVLRFVGLAFGVMLCLHLGLHFAPNFLSDVRGLDVGWIGALGSLNALGITLFNVGLGRLPPRWGILAGQSLTAASLVLLLLVAHPLGIGTAYLLRAGMNLTKLMLVAHIGQRVTSAESGLAFGFTETAIELAYAAALFLAGWLYAVEPSLPFGAALVGLGLTAPLVWLEINRTPPLDSARETTYT